MPQVWEFVFLMLILKLPIVYVCWVVYWAIKAEPHPPEYAVMPARLEPEPRAPWSRPRTARPRPRPRPAGPHGSPVRCYRRTARVHAGL